jgi:hypothetical protein
MLVAKKISNEYWVEAVESAVYILNICSTNSVKNKVYLIAYGPTHVVSASSLPLQSSAGW